MLPERKASAIALGTSASARTTRARFFSMSALNSCSWAMAMARRFSASAWATRLSASAWSAWSLAPMLSPTSMSAMSIERISKAVPASRPAGQHRLGDAVGVLEHLLVALGRADGGDDALADAGDDGLLGGAADEALEVGADGDAGLGLELDAVLGDGVDGVAAAGRGWGSR
jgi:hypothetical protein